MFGNSSPVVTLNIESDSARLLVVRGKKIETFKSVPLTADSMKDTIIANVDEVTTALNNLFKVARVPKTDVVLGLTGLRSVYRIANLPKIKSSKIDEAVRWVAMREFPFKIDRVNLVWQIIGKTRDELKVFLLATPKNILDTTAAAISKAKIKPSAYDVKPLALARFVNMPDAMILDMENDSATIVVVRAGMPHVMHTIVIQHKDQSAVDRVKRIASDLTRTVMFYNNAHEDNPITSSAQIYVTGKLADDPDIIELLKESISYSVQTPEPYLEYPENFPVFEFAVNTGLALRERSVVKKSKAYKENQCPINVNAMPYTK